MNSLVDRLSRWFLAAVFLYSGVDKLFHYGGFVTALESSVLVPAAAGPFLALPVILVEILVGAGLLFRRSRRAAAAVATVLLAVFTAAIAANALYGPPGAPCGCWFTLTLGESNRLHIALNLALLALAASVALTQGQGEEAMTPNPDLVDRGNLNR